MSKMVEEESAPIIVLTPPIGLDGGLVAELRPPNVMQRLLSLFRNVRPGSDLTKFQIPPQFNMPKSQLQSYGEDVYCMGEDYLSKCARGKTSVERFASVVAWTISTARPTIFGLAPFNPILGETHHVSRGNLNVLLEQVSHHPPVSALHATDTEEGIEYIWCHQIVPRFNGISVEAMIKGKRYLRLVAHKEIYEITSPKMLIRFLPSPGAEWTGNAKILCKDAGLEADLCYYRGRSFLGFGGNSHCVKGKIFYSNSLETVYEIDGQWDRTVSLKDVHSGEIRVLYDAKKALSNLNTPVVKNPKDLSTTESALVWGEVSKAIISKDWDRAREAKRSIEERERKLQGERKVKGEVWNPKHFSVSLSKDGIWECRPVQQIVPPAPIIMP